MLFAAGVEVQIPIMVGRKVCGRTGRSGSAKGAVCGMGRCCNQMHCQSGPMHAMWPCQLAAPHRWHNGPCHASLHPQELPRAAGAP